MRALERAELALAGLTVGDAFGERFFVPDATARRMIERRQLPDAPWRMTDDSIMAIGIVMELERNDGIDRDSLAERFAENYRRDPGRGYGAMAHRILRGVAAGEDWSVLSAGAFGGKGSFGNGAAMRIAPLGAYFADDPDRLIEEAERSAQVTHSHPEGIAGAIAIALASAWAWRYGGDSPGREDLVDFVLTRMPGGETREGVAAARALGWQCTVEDAASTLGNGSRISAQDTVPFVLWCAAAANDYREALWSTVAGLGDRDTTCAMVGGIVATAVGPEGIPEEWLRRREPLASWWG